MRSLLSLLAVVSLLAFGCSQPVDSVEPVDHPAADSTQADPGSVLIFVNTADTDRLTAEGTLSQEEAHALVSWRETRGAFESLDQVSSALDSAPRAMLANPMCAYYQGLAQYYSIRALQCAYSICYPMSAWYGYLAQYYQSLAQAVCPTE